MRIKNWIWFVALMGLMLGVGFYRGQTRRAELNKKGNDLFDEDRAVDPRLIQYTELAPRLPTLGKLSALAIAPDGTVYVGGDQAVEVLGGKTVPMAGTPTCLAVDDAGVLWVGLRDHVEFFSKDWKKTVWSSPSEKAVFTSIAVDEWYVYVADAGSRRIWRYKKGGGSPREIGKKDWLNGVRGFNVPTPYFDIAINRRDGSFWAVNPGDHALENYRPDGMPLERWEANSSSIRGFGGCCNPAHFALMPDGSFVTAEQGIPCVKIYGVDGLFRCVVAAPDQFDPDAVGLDVAVDGQGRIYVLDPGRKQVRVFVKKK